jgi:hypothetical protein
MRGALLVSAATVLLVVTTSNAAKPKIVSFGRWLTVKWMVGSEETTPREMKVRSLMVNGDPKEFVTGEPHTVTDKIFVVRRAIRLNDMLPTEAETAPKWKWHPAGWLMVDRATARISKLSLPEFDSYYSQASWYRDYAAYCGVGDGGDRLYAVVIQIGRRKPIVRKLLGGLKNGELPESECEVPVWQKEPTRVTFQPKGGEKISFAVRSHATELPPDDSAEESTQ